MVPEIKDYVVAGASCLHNTWGQLTGSLCAGEGVRGIYESWRTHPNDVYLVSYPKAGHHLTGKVVLEMLSQAVRGEKGLEYYAGHRAVGMLTSVLQLSAMYARDGGWEPGIGQFLRETEGQRYRLYKNHINPMVFAKLRNVDRATKFVITVRNPKDTLVSMYFFCRGIYEKERTREHSTCPEFIGLDEFFRHFMNGLVFYNHYWHFYIAWHNYAQQHLEGDRVLWLRYEDLVLDKRGAVGRIGRFLGLEGALARGGERALREIEERTAFNTMRAETLRGEGGASLPALFSEQSFFRRGKVGDWREHLTPAQSEEVDLVTRTLFHGIPVLSSYSEGQFGESDS